MSFKRTIRQTKVCTPDNFCTPDRQDKSCTPGHRRRKFSVEDHVQGVLTGDRVMLARTITLVESHAPSHLELEQEILTQISPHTGESIRLGITGAPGVGKSTFIEALGCYLCEQNHRVAVLAIDPSSRVTHGSILGDKTRMERLARQPNAFIRPSPSGGALGGVARKTRESMLVCEAAGYDVILIETVGVGQSESAVRAMVDFILLLLLPGAGDELQGIKKGVIELADALIINKADGDNLARAENTRQEYAGALHYLPTSRSAWNGSDLSPTPPLQGEGIPVLTCSAINGTGIPDIWAIAEAFRQQTTQSGLFAERRRTQLREWLHTLLEDELLARFYQHPQVAAELPTFEQAVTDGTLPVMSAVTALLKTFHST